MMTKKIWYFIFAAILVVSCGKDDDEELYGNWTKRYDFKGYSRSGASCFIIGNDAYMALGYNGDNTNSRYRDLWVYDVTKDSWSQKANLPAEAKARSHASGFAIGEKGYICAGLTEENRVTSYLKDLWEYNSLTDTWSKKADLPDSAEPRAEAIGVVLNGKGYFGTGRNNKTQLKDFYQYDPTTNTWVEKNEVGGSKRSGATSFVINNTIYVCLGVSNSAYLTDLVYYDEANDIWQNKRAMRNATDESFDDKYNMQRANGASFILDGKVYITLGASGSFRYDTWEYDYASDVWTQRTNFEGGARSNAIAFSVYDVTKSKQRAFVATGGTSNTSLYSDVWEYVNEEVNENDNDN